MGLFASFALNAKYGGAVERNGVAVGIDARHWMVVAIINWENESESGDVGRRKNPSG